MNGVSELELRYRRLLGWYPAAFKDAYAEEMIGVLLAAARADGRRRPGFADTADLIAGAVRARLRGEPDPGWRDALALTSLLAPLLLAVLLPGQDLGWMARMLWHSWQGQGTSVSFWPLWPVGALLTPLALGLLGLRRIGAGATLALAAWIAAQASLTGGLQDPRLAAYLVLLLVQAAAMTASPGPRHGLRLISPRGIAMALPWLAATAYAGGLIPTHYPVPLALAEVVIGLGGLAGLATLASASGRRVLVLLAGIPGSAFAVSLMTFASVNFYAFNLAFSQVALYLPPLLLTGAAVVAIRRSDRTPKQT
jgi:hypothetical protein